MTVPVLCVELLAVTSLTGARLRNLRFTTMAAAFLMILTGFIGKELNTPSDNLAAILVWGAISTVFYLYLYWALYRAVRETLPDVYPEEVYVSHERLSVPRLSGTRA